MHEARNLTAAACALAASAVLSLIDNYVAAVSKDAGIWQFQLFRTVISAILVLCWARISGMAWRPLNFRRTAVRSLTVASGLLVYFATLVYLPVAQAGAGLFSAPIWVLVFSVILFGARPSVATIIAALGGFIGVLMLLQPSVSALSIATLFPLLAGAIYGAGMMLTRFWLSEEGPICLALGVFTTIAIISVIALDITTLWSGESTGYLTRGWAPLTANFLWLTLFQSIGAAIAVPLISQAYRIGTPAFVSVFEYSFLVFAAIWTVMIWGQSPNMAGITGIAIILLFATIAAFDQNRRPA